MHSPSPSPSPPPPASLFEDSMANENPDHSTHRGLAEAGTRRSFVIDGSQINANLLVDHASGSNPSAVDNGPAIQSELAGTPYLDWNVTQNVAISPWGPVNYGVSNTGHPFVGNQTGGILDSAAAIIAPIMEPQMFPYTGPNNFGIPSIANFLENTPENWAMNGLDSMAAQMMPAQMPFNNSFTFMDQPQLDPNVFSPGLAVPMLPMPAHTQRPLNFCGLCTASFTRPSDLQRHHESVHLGIKYNCYWPRCRNNRGNGYCRAEKLRTHQRNAHGMA